MRLSVIIPCYNDAGLLPVQLEALAHQAWHEPWEVLIADNGSTDALADVVERYRSRVPHLRIVDASGRKGVSHARNVGVCEAAGERLVFVDADDEVAPGWVAAIGDALADAELVASRHEFGKLNTGRFQRSRRNAQDKGLQPYRYPPYLPHAAGSGLGIRRETYEAVGPFDEDLQNLQDTDYCWRAQLAGAKLVFVPDAVVHYRFRDTLRGMYVQGMNYGEYNVLLYKRFRDRGMPHLSWKRGVKAWFNLLTSVHELLDADKRLYWIRRFAFRFGRLKGCVKYRVLAP